MAGLYFNQLICKDIMDSKKRTKKPFMYVWMLWSYQSIWGLQTWCQLLILKNNYNCTYIERMRFQNSPKLNKPQNTFRNHLTPLQKGAGADSCHYRWHTRIPEFPYVADLTAILASIHDTRRFPKTSVRKLWRVETPNEKAPKVRELLNI